MTRRKRKLSEDAVVRLVPLTDADREAAHRVVAARALDVEDLGRLLDVLGLDPPPGAPGQA